MCRLRYSTISASYILSSPIFSFSQATSSGEIIVRSVSCANVCDWPLRGDGMSLHDIKDDVEEVEQEEELKLEELLQDEEEAEQIEDEGCS